MFTESQIAALIRHGMEAVPALPDPPDWGTAMRLRDVYAVWAQEVRGMLYGDYGFDLHESYRARLDQHGTPTPAVFMEPSAAAPVLTALATHYGQHIRFYHDHACRMRPPHPYTPERPVPHPDLVWRCGWREPNHEPSAYNWIGYQRGKY